MRPSFALDPGGKDSDQAVAAAKHGADISFLSWLGRDLFADMAPGTRAGAGVKPVVTQSDDSYTGAAYIFVEEASGDNVIIVCLGAAATKPGAGIEAEANLIRSDPQRSSRPNWSNLWTPRSGPSRLPGRLVIARF